MSTDQEAKEDFEVGYFQPCDAQGVVSLFQAVYGDYYPIRLFYDPQAIIAANEAGKYYSIVARTTSGIIIGAVHLFRSAPFAAVYESGAGLVLADYRNTGANTRMLEYLYEEFVPRHSHIEEIFGEAVCNHVYMQKTLLRFKHVEAAIELALMPAKAYDKEKSATGRVAAVSCFRCYHPKPHPIYLPAVYEQQLREIYSHLNYTHKIETSGGNPPANTFSRIETEVFDFASVARITIHEIGNDFFESFTHHEKQVLSKKAVVIQAWLDLGSPSVGHAVNDLKKRGYFFGGALPRWFDRDGLLMQKLLCPPDFDSIKLESDDAKRLLEMIKEDRKYVNTEV